MSRRESLNHKSHKEIRKPGEEGETMSSHLRDLQQSDSAVGQLDGLPYKSSILNS